MILRSFLIFGCTALAALWLGLISGTAPARAEPPVVVFAAASLKGPLDLIASDWKALTGTSVAVSYGGSSVLARQIEAGAPADLFLSANEDWMDVLDQAGLLRPDTRRDLLRNRLVLIAHGRAAAVTMSSATDPAVLVGDGPLAMALVDAVPAGIYGKAALTTLGLWDKVAAHVVQTDNVRAALSLVALGEAPFGIVYATDAMADPRVTIVADFNASTHPAILYPGAVIASTTHDKALDLIDYISSPAALQRFQAAGFDAAGAP